MKNLLFFLPVFAIVFSNIVYDISAKLFPGQLNAQAGLAIVYAIAAGVSLLLFVLTSKNTSFSKELKKINWATFSLALGCTGIDLGYVLLFRAGWDISFGSLACNIFLAITLILVGTLFYKEKLTKDHLAGIALCLAGLILINV